MSKKYSAWLCSSLLLLNMSFSAQGLIVTFSDLVCESIATDNKRKFKKIIRVYRVKVRHFYEESLCENYSLLRYALLNQAYDVGVFIVKELSPQLLARQEQDGYSVIEWAQQQQLDNVVIQSINNRLQRLP